MDEGYHVDTQMEVLTNPTSIPVSERGYGVRSPTSPGGLSTSSVSSASGGRHRPKAPKYNRNTVKMEDYMNRSPEKITAKEYRVLIPQMFQASQYPEKAINRTKVKGLWDMSSRPADWPTDIKFRDPNNIPKYSLQDSKKVFVYLREKLMQSQNNRIQLKQEGTPVIGAKPSRMPLSLKQEPLSPSATVFQGPLEFPSKVPNLPQFEHNPGHMQPTGTLQTRQEGHSIQVRQLHNNARVLAVQPMMQERSIPIPVKDMEEMAKVQGVSLKREISRPASVVTQVDPMMYDDTDQSLMSKPQAVPVDNQESYQESSKNNSMLTNLSVMHNTQMISTEDGQWITVIQDETETQPLHPQTTDVVQQVTETLQEDPECMQFAVGIQETLTPIVEKFCHTFEADPSVMSSLECLLQETFVPLFNMAKASKTNCGELSKLGGRLQEMLKRWTFMSDDISPNEIIEELKILEQNFQIITQEVIICHDVPIVGEEVMVMRAETDSTPTLKHDSRDHFIPTIEGLNARAKQKEMELESSTVEVLSGWKDAEEKVVVHSLMSPMCRDLEDMNIEESVDDHNSFGIKMREHEIEGDEEKNSNQSPVDLQALMNDLDFLNTAGQTIFQTMGIATRDQPVQNTAGNEQEQAAVVDPVGPYMPFTGSESPKVNEVGFEESNAALSFEENNAVDAMMASAAQYYGGSSVTLETPLHTNPASDYVDESDALDNILSLEDDWGEANLESFEMSSSIVVDEPTFTMPQPQATTPAVTEESVMLMLRKLMEQKKEKAVIPTTVLEASNKTDVEDRHTVKKSRANKGKRAVVTKADLYEDVRRHNGKGSLNHGLGRYGKHM